MEAPIAPPTEIATQTPEKAILPTQDKPISKDKHRIAQMVDEARGHTWGKLGETREELKGEQNPTTHNINEPNRRVPQKPKEPNLMANIREALPKWLRFFAVADPRIAFQGLDDAAGIASQLNPDMQNKPPQQHIISPDMRPQPEIKSQQTTAAGSSPEETQKRLIVPGTSIEAKIV